MNRQIIRAAVLGTAAGDALGVPVEFKSRESLRADPVTGMRAYGTHDQPAGTWSDDTSMLLATLDSLLESYDPGDIMERFDRWLGGAYTPYGEVFDRGMIVTQAVMRYRRGEAPLRCGGFGVRDNGNGSIMRIMPACLYAVEKERKGELTLEEAVDQVHEVSSLTHAHAISRVGCGLYFFMVRALILREGGALEDALGRGLSDALAFYRHAGQESLEDAIRTYGRLWDLNAFRQLPESDISSTGYVVDTLEAALWCLLNTDSLEGALLRAVNLGHDTDTVAAVAGGLAGLYYGEEAIPAAWLDVLARREWIESLCDRAAQRW